jgi:hypothetical protein
LVCCFQLRKLHSSNLFNQVSSLQSR